MKTALITGGSSGLGLEMAKILACSGYVPLLLARRGAQIDAATNMIRESGREAFGFEADVTDPKSLERVAQEAGNRFGKIDFLVLNAGVVHVKLLADYTDFDEMKQDLEVNLWGTILSARIFTPLMESGSKILIVSSGFGLMGAAGYSIYCAAKAGLVNFAEALRRELLSKGVSVQVACPGDMDTPQYRREKESMPGWMRNGNSARPSVLHPRTAASRILKQCRGKRFFVHSDFEIGSLALLARIFPRRLRDRILDGMFPRP